MLHVCIVLVVCSTWEDENRPHAGFHIIYANAALPRCHWAVRKPAHESERLPQFELCLCQLRQAFAVGNSGTGV